MRCASFSARYWPELTARLAEGNDAGGTVSLIELLPSAAWLPLRAGEFAVGPELVVAVGRLTARGVGIAQPDTDHTWLLRSDLNVCAHFSRRGLPIAGVVAVGAGIPWSRPELTINRGDQVFAWLRSVSAPRLRLKSTSIDQIAVRGRSW